MTQHTDPKESFQKAMQVIRQTGTRFNGTGFQKVRLVGFNPVLEEARRPVPVVNKPWDPHYFEVLAAQVGPATAGRLIHAGVVHQ